MFDVVLSNFLHLKPKAAFLPRHESRINSDKAESNLNNPPKEEAAKPKIKHGLKRQKM